ncbi:hypothetical protein KNP414_07224 [Paenibacillus mucilaginosus KNP414]|uniref:Uncharacterized protein n=1 Tax=Paenibacillus mucilaginosus (strain KNP414) TaxID=1036673 RepID=F8FN64_PAEMK|nr:hypothetical protein KNP414_07224 [Paenibacillus mucilaginosus KNP414]
MLYRHVRPSRLELWVLHRKRIVLYLSSLWRNMLRGKFGVIKMLIVSVSSNIGPDRKWSY